MRKIADSELVLTKNKKIYHLDLGPDEIAPTIILVGDPGRVAMVSSFFDTIHIKRQHREFITHTGEIGKMPISVIATGIGTDNIDIVLNELDALVNIDLEDKTENSEKKSLKLIRIGTCGSLSPELDVDNFVLSGMAIGLDNLLLYYRDAHNLINHPLAQSFKSFINDKENRINPYVAECGSTLFNQLNSDQVKAGITLTAPGFYGPQGRHLRLTPYFENLNDRIYQFEFQGKKILNFEMETSALYGLSKLLGHQAATICLVVANRYKKTFSNNYQQMMKKLIQYTLENLSQTHT